MSLAAKIPGLAVHTVPAAAPPPVVEVTRQVETVSSAAALPAHREMVSRHGLPFVLSVHDDDVAVLQAHFPVVPVVGPDDIAALREVGQVEADLAMQYMSIFPGARVHRCKVLGQGMSPEALERYRSRRRT